MDSSELKLRITSSSGYTVRKVNTTKYILLFVLIQAVAAVLAIVGLPICAYLAFFGPLVTKYAAINRDVFIATFPSWAWLWSNDDDGVYPMWYHRVHPTRSMGLTIFVWTALRNPVANLKHVPGVSGIGRPLYYRTWLVKGKLLYFKAGWMSNGFPALSAGSGKGY